MRHLTPILYLLTAIAIIGSGILTLYVLSSDYSDPAMGPLAFVLVIGFWLIPAWSISAILFFLSLAVWAKSSADPRPTARANKQRNLAPNKRIEPIISRELSVPAEPVAEAIPKMDQKSALPQQTQTKSTIAGQWIMRSGIAVVVLGSAFNLAGIFYFLRSLQFGAFTGALVVISAIKGPLILGAIIYAIGALISRLRR